MASTATVGLGVCARRCAYASMAGSGMVGLRATPCIATAGIHTVRTSQRRGHLRFPRHSTPAQPRIPHVLPSPPARGFATARPMRKEHYFDTLALVERLQKEGLSKEQAEGIMRVMTETIDDVVENLSRTMVRKEEQEKITYTQKVDFAKLRSELHSQSDTELSLTRNEYERLTTELTKLNSRLKEEITRAQNSFRLDLNLEKGRIREESSQHELKIKETDTRIESEVGLLRGLLENVKFSTLQWLIGVCTGTAAVILGIWRLLM